MHNTDMMNNWMPHNFDVKGSIAVKKNNMWTGNIYYQVLFLKDRLLFIRTGNQDIISIIFPVIGVTGLGPIVGKFYGAIGYLVGGMLGGLIGFGIGAIFAKMNKAKLNDRLNNLRDKSIEEIIKADKKKFEISYNDITNIKVNDSMVGLYGLRLGALIIEGVKKLKFDIIDTQRPEEIKRLVSSISQ